MRRKKRDARALKTPKHIAAGEKVETAVTRDRLHSHHKQQEQLAQAIPTKGIAREKKMNVETKEESAGARAHTATKPEHDFDEAPGHCEQGLLSLPPELISAILEFVGDRDFCRCQQAGALFWPPHGDTTVDLRKARWRGRVEAHDFCATGNTEALALLMQRSAPFDAGRCVVNAIVHGHGDHVLKLLYRAGVINDITDARNTWRQDICREAARLGRVDVLSAEWQPHVPMDTILNGAIDGDSLEAFHWVCATRGSGPSSRDIADVATSGAVAILRHYRHMPLDCGWDSIAEKVSYGPAGIEVVLLCMGDAPSIGLQRTVCIFICHHALAGDLDLFYERFPDAFGYFCLIMAAQSKNLDAARWLCQRFPAWNDPLVESLVRLGPINQGPFEHIDFSLGAKWLYDAGLVADVPRMARVAAEHAIVVHILVHIIDTTLPTMDVSPSGSLREDADAQLQCAEARARANKVRSAAVAGALARFLATGDSAVHDLLVQRGITAPCLDRIRMASFRASLSFARNHP
nr:hypothetical protein [Pandoravirus massiliensis]